jgi:hypothetical protein
MATSASASIRSRRAPLPRALLAISKRADRRDAIVDAALLPTVESHLRQVLAYLEAVEQLRSSRSSICSTPAWVAISAETRLVAN